MVVSITLFLGIVFVAVGYFSILYLFWVLIRLFGLPMKIFWKSIFGLVK